MKSVRWILAIVAAFHCVLISVVCVLILVVPGPASPPAAPSLRIAYSPEKESLFADLVEGFNRANRGYRIEAVKLDPDDLIDQAVEGSFGAVSPDSSVWLDQIDRRWQAKSGTDARLTASLARYAASPIVIAAWQSVARDLGYPDRPVSWATILERALRDPNFRWSHPSSTTAMGLLATTAEFYAGAGNPPKLERADIERATTLDYVRRVERTVQQYGAETEDALIARLLQPGGRTLDAFVVQEQLVVQFNGRTTGEKLVALYPADGTLWLDHPLALLDGPWIGDQQRRAYRSFVDYLGQPEIGARVLAAGYRPADLRIPIDDRSSPIRRENGVDPAQPFTTLPLPATAVLESIRESWALLKRPANIYLVVDVSGSMQGERINRTREALLSFVGQIRDGRDRVALVQFATSARELVSLDTLDHNRADLERAIKGLQTGGNTAYYDAVDYAVGRLADRKEADRINVVLAMTDGEENASRADLVAGRGNPSKLIAAIQDKSRRSGIPVVVFTVAYGGEAELDVLEQISEATRGQAYRSDPDTIRKLYRLLSAAF